MSQVDETRRRRLAEVVIALAGAVMVILAVLADQAWFDRHFIRPFFIPRPIFQAVESGGRLALAAAGLIAALVLRPVVGRLAARASPASLAAQALRIALAIALAVVLGEVGLGAMFSHAAEQGGAKAEPLRKSDPRLGWVFAPARAARASVGGRRIDYAFDARGHRVPSLARPVDPSRPTLVFAGESILTGFGLRWDESIPAQVAAALGLQSANLSVFGYADDQTYLRLAGELPRFSRPVAVVVLFSPGLSTWSTPNSRPTSTWPARTAPAPSSSCRGWDRRIRSSRPCAAAFWTTRACPRWRSSPIPDGAFRATCTPTPEAPAPSRRRSPGGYVDGPDALPHLRAVDGTLWRGPTGASCNRAVRVMSGIILAGLWALASLGESDIPAAHPAPAPTIFDQARARQTFYPVGRLEGDGMKMAYYLMGGQLLDRTKAAAQSAVLVNLTADRGLVQVVELQRISCASGQLAPTFRMMFDADGQALASSGPVKEGAEETLLSSDAVRQTMAILCDGAEPANAMHGKTMTEVR